MNTFIRKWIALAILIPGTALCAESRGLVLYTEPPADYVVPLEFVTLTATSVAYVTVVSFTGKQQEIPRGGIIAIINYPPEIPTASLAAEVETTTRKIQALIQKYPDCRVRLNAALTKWTTGLDAYRQHLSKAVPQKAVTTLTLTVDGVSYAQVVLTSFDGTTISIDHEAGVARIPAIKLKPEQIVALNATSTTARIEATRIISPPSPGIPATVAAVGIKPERSQDAVPPSGPMSGSTSPAPRTKSQSGTPVDHDPIIGDPIEDFVRTFGKPVKIRLPIHKPANTSYVFYGGFTKKPYDLWVEALDGKVIRVEYQNAIYRASDVSVLLNKHSDGFSWQPVTDPILSERYMFERQDEGAYAFTYSKDPRFLILVIVSPEVAMRTKAEAQRSIQENIEQSERRLK
jgi:hypothetical protein